MTKVHVVSFTVSKIYSFFLQSAIHLKIKKERKISPYKSASESVNEEDKFFFLLPVYWIYLLLAGKFWEQICNFLVRHEKMRFNAVVDENAFVHLFKKFY